MRIRLVVMRMKCHDMTSGRSIDLFRFRFESTSKGNLSVYIHPTIDTETIVGRHIVKGAPLPNRSICLGLSCRVVFVSTTQLVRTPAYCLMTKS